MNVATDAGGLCCVKYGVTRDYVIGVEIVTGTGDVVRLGRETAKGVAGYDLAGLMAVGDAVFAVANPLASVGEPMSIRRVSEVSGPWTS